MTNKQRFAISEGLKRHYKENPSKLTGTHHSKETKQKIAKSVKKSYENKKNPEEHKKRISIGMDIYWLKRKRKEYEERASKTNKT